MSRRNWRHKQRFGPDPDHEYHQKPCQRVDLLESGSVFMAEILWFVNIYDNGFIFMVIPNLYECEKKT